MNPEGKERVGVNNTPTSYTEDNGYSTYFLFLTFFSTNGHVLKSSLYFFTLRLAMSFVHSTVQILAINHPLSSISRCVFLDAASTQLPT